jgi:DNA polymerase-3 subunit epsilon
MVKFVLIFAVPFFLYFVIKTLLEKWSRKRKIARIPAEKDAKRWENIARIRDDWHEEYTTALKQKSETPPTRKHAKPEIDKFLDVKRKTQIIIFDVETNGLSGNYSVLSCSAIKYEINPNTCEMTEIDRFNRYYYPVEQFDPQAIAVNGLTREVITVKRRDSTYPEHFTADDDFKNFCNGVVRFVAHNISFDMQFVPFISNKKRLCTMMTNMDIVAAGFLKWKNEWKWPKLSETAVHYGIQFSESELHSSMADAEITAKIFMKMLETARIS